MVYFIGRMCLIKPLLEVGTTSEFNFLRTTRRQRPVDQRSDIRTVVDAPPRGVQFTRVFALR
jgi:hypothetical protein